MYDYRQKWSKICKCYNEEYNLDISDDKHLKICWDLYPGDLYTGNKRYKSNPIISLGNDDGDEDFFWINKLTNEEKESFEHFVTYTEKRKDSLVMIGGIRLYHFTYDYDDYLHIIYDKEKVIVLEGSSTIRDFIFILETNFS